MKLFILLGLFFSLSAFATGESETAETVEAVMEMTEVMTVCLTEDAVMEWADKGYLCAPMLDEEGAAMEGAVLCAMAGTADVILRDDACEELKEES